MSSTACSTSDGRLGVSARYSNNLDSVPGRRVMSALDDRRRLEELYLPSADDFVIGNVQLARQNGVLASDPRLLTCELVR